MNNEDPEDANESYENEHRKTMDTLQNGTDNGDLEMVQTKGRGVRYPHAKWQVI